VTVLDIRQRSGYLFLAVVLGQMILISAQVNSHSGVPVLESVAFGVFAEVQRGASSVVSGVRRGWSGYIGLRGVRAENDALKRELAAAEVQLQVQRALADRSRSLEQLLELRDRSNLTTTAAEIIADSATPDFRTMTIDKGARDGVATDMAVIAPAGVVGRVVVPSARAAKVQLLIDRNAAAGALVERSRAQGVVVGVGDYRLHMEYVSEVSDVVTGDLVVTSGIDGIFPKGFVIGQVESVEKNGSAYKQIVIRPAVDFRSLENVLVVLTPTAAHEAEQPTPAGRGGAGGPSGPGGPE
jgi:rod shape-determining protein MreC